MTHWCKILICAFATAMLLGAAVPAHAQDMDIGGGGGCEDEGQKPEDAGSFRKVERNGETVYEFTGTIRVCGKVPKPNVVVILLEKTVGYEWEKLKQDFLPKIDKSLQGAPF